MSELYFIAAAPESVQSSSGAYSAKKLLLLQKCLVEYRLKELNPDKLYRDISSVDFILQPPSGTAAIISAPVNIKKLLDLLKLKCPAENLIQNPGDCIYSARGGSLRSKFRSPDGDSELSPELALEFIRAVNLPENIQRHVLAVRDMAMHITDKLEAFVSLDSRLIESSAILHDICREEKNHAAAGAALISALGFNRAADIIRQHHDPDSDEINEAAVVYLADKLVKEDRPVSLEERFAASKAKCKSPEALAAHERRYLQAVNILDKIQRLCNYSLNK